MIKYLLTKLGRAGWENIWLSVMALGPYAMTSSQIFPIRPRLPLSQKVHNINNSKQNACLLNKQLNNN